MKNLLVFIFLLNWSAIFAQSYLSFPDSNAVWIQGQFLFSAYNNHEHATITQPLSFGNDTTINGNLYHTLRGHAIADWIDGWGNQQNYQTGTDFIPEQTVVIFRQDISNKRVYQWDFNTNQEHVLYDFNNLIVGQPYPPTLNNWHYPQLKVMGIDSVLLIDGIYHDRWILGSNEIDSGFVSIIEGVGSTMGFNLPLLVPFEQTSATLCFSANGTIIYDNWRSANSVIPPRYSAECLADLSVPVSNNEIGVSIYPNPFNDFIVIDCSERIEKLIIYDIIGKILIEQIISNEANVVLPLSDLPKGSYQLKIIAESKRFTTKTIFH